MPKKPEKSFAVFDRRAGRVIDLYATEPQAKAAKARREFADGTLTRYEVRDLSLAPLRHVDGR